MEQVRQIHHFCGQGSSCLLRFCIEEMKTEDLKSIMRTAVAEEFKTWLLWTLNAYPGVKAASSLNNYWQVPKMVMLDVVDRQLERSLAKDVDNVRYTSPLFTSRRICTLCLVSGSPYEGTQASSNFSD